MTLTLRSSSGNFHENERLTRARVNNPTTFNRFLSFNDNKSASAENRRRLLESTPNLIELLEEDEDDFDDPQALCHECSTCSKVFACEYGLNYHTNMHHPNQAVLCTLCHITFRSHRSLKTHQQRRHTPHQTIRNNGKSNSIHPLPSYQYLSPYLMLAFSSQQFPSMAKKACEDKRLPLGSFSSLLYRCSTCQISFPCSRTLKKHQLEEHEHHEYNLCRTILHDIIVQIEEQSSRTVDNDNANEEEFQTMALILAKQASHFGLKTKPLAEKSRLMKAEDRRLISPTCQHRERTCANLCLQYLSSYDKLIQNYSYSIPIVPKGNIFAQGSIVSNIPLTIALSLTPSSTIDNNATQEINNNNNNNTMTRAKRRSIKHIDGTTSPQLKRKNPSSNGTNTNNGKTNRSNGIKNETKPVLLEAPASAPPIVKKSLPKDIVRSSSKRTLSPSITVQTEPLPSKRRRARTDKNPITSPSSPAATVIKIVEDDDDDDDVEQENDDDDDDDDIIPIDTETSNQLRPSKKRQASSGSVEYVQSLDDDQQSASSLNNIENLNSKSKSDDDEIMICHSTPSKNKAIPTQTKTSSKASINGNNKSKSTSQRLINSDDNVRVRCKICGEILEGRSRFSQHVISQHGHLLKKNMTESKQQQQQTAFVR